MTGLRWYLMRLLICAFAVSLTSALLKKDRLRAIVRLCGGCLLAVAALQPLLQFDLSSLPDVLYPYGFSQQNAADEAARKNEALLESLIRAQTEALIAEELQAQGIEAEFHLELRMDQDVGAPVPWAVTIDASACTPRQRAAFSDYLRDTLAIPEERQRWNIP